MPLERSGKEYLFANESAQYLDVSFTTFQLMQKEYGLVGVQFSGQGRRVFFLKRHLDLIKNYPVDKADEVREIIRQEQAEA